LLKRKVFRATRTSGQECFGDNQKWGGKVGRARAMDETAVRKDASAGQLAGEILAEQCKQQKLRRRTLGVWSWWVTPYRAQSSGKKLRKGGRADRSNDGAEKGESSRSTRGEGQQTNEVKPLQRTVEGLQEKATQKTKKGMMIRRSGKLKFCPKSRLQGSRERNATEKENRGVRITRENVSSKSPHPSQGLARGEARCL